MSTATINRLTTDTADQVRTFADILYAASDVVEVRRIRGKDVRSVWVPAGKLLDQVESFTRDNADGWGIFIGINPREKVGDRGDKAIALARVVFIDFDHTTVAEALAKIAGAGLPTPTIIIDSGHGAHAYWLLDHPTDDLEAWRELQHDLAVSIGGDANCRNPERVMGLPGFINLKEPQAPRTIIDCDPTRTVSFDTIRKIVPVRAKPVQRLRMTRQVTADVRQKAIRCRKYLSRLPDAISGSGGHRATFRAACETIRFGLEGSDAYDLMEWWSATKSDPQWSDKELRHKLDEAQKKAGHEFGCRLSEIPPRVNGNGRHKSAPPPRNQVDEPIATQSPSDAAISPVLTRLSDIEPREIHWLWHGRIPLGRISVLVGVPGAGKSYTTADFSARVSTGTPWPDGAECQRGSVLLISAEDDPHDTTRPRLDAHGADVTRIHLLSAVRFLSDGGKHKERVFTLDDIGPMEDAMKSIPDLRLVVIDPIGSYMGGKVDSYRDTEVRSVLAPAAALAEKYGPALLVVAHRPKGHRSSADEAVMGSRAFTGIARAVWHICRDPQDRARRLLLPGKQNLSKEPTGLAFALQGEPVASLVWEKNPIDLSADAGLAAEQEATNPGRPPEERQEAEGFLRSELEDFAEHAVADIRASAKEIGLTWRTVQRAASTLRIIRHRATFGGGMVWRLPRPGASRANTPDTRANCGTNEEYGTNGNCGTYVENPLKNRAYVPEDIHTCLNQNLHACAGARATPDEYDQAEREALRAEGM